jgi:hypothetical protein
MACPIAFSGWARYLTPRLKVTRSNRVGCATKLGCEGPEVSGSKTHHKLTKNSPALAQALRFAAGTGDTSTAGEAASLMIAFGRSCSAPPPINRVIRISGEDMIGLAANVAARATSLTPIREAPLSSVTQSKGVSWRVIWPQ